MTTLVSVSPRELMNEHLAVLRDRARSVLLKGERLDKRSESECQRRMAEFLAIGASFRLTQKELVCLVLRGLFAQRPGCRCPACRSE